MRIRMRTRYAGPAGTFGPGSERECSAEEGAALVAGGYAVCLDPPEAKKKKVEKAAPKHVAEVKTTMASSPPQAAVRRFGGKPVKES